MSQIRQRIAAFLLAAAASMSALPSAAQQVTAESLAASRELMSLTKADQSLDQFIGMMMPQIGQLLEQANPDQGALVRKIMDELVLPELRKSIPEAVDEAAAIYARTFTQAELNEVIAFYQTPVGQKFIERQSALMIELGQAGQAWGQRTAIKVLRDLAPKLKEQGIDVPI